MLDDFKTEYVHAYKIITFAIILPLSREKINLTITQLYLRKGEAKALVIYLYIYIRLSIKVIVLDLFAPLIHFIYCDMCAV